MAGKLPRLSRLPIRNAPLQVASSLIDVAEVYSSDLSESEKTIAYGEAGGSLAGSLAGAALGASIGSVVPVVGTLIGGLVGGAIGAWGGSELGASGTQSGWRSAGGLGQQAGGGRTTGRTRRGCAQLDLRAADQPDGARQRARAAAPGRRVAALPATHACRLRRRAAAAQPLRSGDGLRSPHGISGTIAGRPEVPGSRRRVRTQESGQGGRSGERRDQRDPRRSRGAGEPARRIAGNGCPAAACHARHRPGAGQGEPRGLHL